MCQFQALLLLHFLLLSLSLDFSPPPADFSCYIEWLASNSIEFDWI